MKRLVIIPALHAVILIAEVIAFIHDIQAFGIGMFQYYTINSNLLQMIVSACFLVYFLRKKDVPAVFEMLHLVSAVGLTITFLIAAFVLAPQEGFAYYFLSNVAPINHFFGPVLSVITFIFAVQRNPLRTGSIFAPMVFTLLYSRKGSSGKSTLLDMLKAVLGKRNVIPVNIESMADKFALANLPFASAIISDENNTSKYLDQLETLKAIITHNTVFVRDLYKSYKS